MPAIEPRAPADTGGILAVPGFDTLPPLIAENHSALDRPDISIGGLSLRDFRSLARHEALRLAVEYHDRHREHLPLNPTGLSPDRPLIVAGHQPELVHPGVWAKNFALNGLARQVNGIPLNLIVDNDTLKTASVRLPVVAGAKEVRLGTIPFDDFHGETPYEDRRVANPVLFASFPHRVAAVRSGWGFEPLLDSVWGSAAESDESLIGERFASMRRRTERLWGCVNLELPVSLLAGTSSFTRFAAHLASDAARFRTIYNGATAAYRQANGIRNKQHPVPDLGPDELPFWVRTEVTGRRSRATVGSDPGHFRPRALTLTLFARVCLGDFFIHGIGGGKYDEVTDAIIRDYFGLKPPAYQILSATLHLPFPGFPVNQAGAKRLAHQVRDLHWNPQRHLPAGWQKLPELRELVSRKADWVAREPVGTDRPARRLWFRELRGLTESLRRAVADDARIAAEDLERISAELAANAILRRRDYPWVFYPEQLLRTFLQHFLRH